MTPKAGLLANCVIFRYHPCTLCYDSIHIGFSFGCLKPIGSYELGTDTVEDFFKSCKRDLSSAKKIASKKKAKGPKVFPFEVLIYEKAKETAKRDFNLFDDNAIKQFLVDIGVDCCHHHKYSKMEKNVWIIPAGHCFNVYFFDYKTSKDGYLAILFYSTKGKWIIKSLAKNTTDSFSNPLAEKLQNILSQNKEGVKK